MIESESENSDIAISKIKEKKKKTEEESGSDSKGLNTKLEQFCPALVLKKQFLFLTMNLRMNLKKI